MFHADVEHHSQSFLRKVVFSTQFSDALSELNWLKVHFIPTVSSFVKNSQTAETVGHGNEIGIRIMKSGQKAKDGRKGPS